jgi:hypothetical protein
MGGYDDAYGRWRRDSEGFWRAASDAIEWDRAPRRSSTSHGNQARHGFRGVGSAPVSMRSIATCETVAAHGRR